MKTPFAFVIFTTLLLAAAIPAFASGWNAGPEQVIRKPVKGNVHMSSGTIVVNARVEGDFVAAGGTIVLNDSVMGDVLVAGGNLTINGFVGDDIRAAGGTVRIKKDVSGDVIVAGGKVEVDPGVIIAGNLILMSGQAVVNGTVQGNVRAMGEEFTLNGTVEKELHVKGRTFYMNGTAMGKSKIAVGEIVLQDQAEFHQEVAYWQKAGSQNFGKALVGATAKFRPDMRVGDNGSRWYYLGFSSVLLLLLYLASVLLLLFVLQYIFAPVLGRAGATLEKHIPRKLGYGLAYLLAVPLGAVLLLVTVVGIPVGLVALVLYAFTVVMAHVITSLVVANWYNSNYSKLWNKNTIAGAAFVIFILIKLISIIPYAGWLLSVMLICIAFGAIIHYIRHQPAPTLAS